jgi:hypothetical protein
MGLIDRGAGNNRAVSTATASSFLNAARGLVVSVAGTGCRCSPAAGRSRRAGTARPARRPRSAPAAGSRRRVIPCGRRRPGTPGSARPAAGGAPPTGRGAPRRCPGPRPPSPGEFVHIGGDAVDDRGHPRQADGDEGPVWPVGGRAQADRRQVAAPVELPEPARALPQPVHLVRQAAGEVIAAVQVSILIAVGVFGGWPARCPQFTERRLQRVQAGIGHDLVHPGR